MCSTSICNGDLDPATLYMTGKGCIRLYNRSFTMYYRKPIGQDARKAKPSNKASFTGRIKRSSALIAVTMGAYATL